jgi:hypothetical protein
LRLSFSEQLKDEEFSQLLILFPIVSTCGGQISAKNRQAHHQLGDGR